ncbi:MAG: sugar ABC transporter permease, partial [Roseobacter sp.]
MTDQTTDTEAGTDHREGMVSRFIRETELDTRLLGMIGALALIWTGFHFYGAIFNGFGAFLTPRNLWNLSVQTA